MTRGRLLRAVRDRVIAALGRGHVAGPTVEDAVRVAEQEATAGGTTTLGPWSASGDDPKIVLARQREAVSAIASAGLPASVSIKLPELHYDERLLADVLSWAAAHRVGIHLDSLQADTAGATFERLREVVADHPDIGCTLPGRWARSVRDAEDVVGMGVRSVRVVKGQWEDPGDPKRDPADGMLEVVDALRGGGAAVGVATHDEGLAARCLERLVASDTDCRLEQLYGLPRLDVALFQRQLGVGHLLYVPYGEAYLPYALTQALRHPRILAWAARDLVGHPRRHQPSGLEADRPPVGRLALVTDR